MAPNGQRGRKRKVSDASASDGSTHSTPTKGVRAKAAKVSLTWESFPLGEVGERVLSCGEGEQLGHPGRQSTKKPRKVDLIEEEELIIRQVVAGGVHSVLLTTEGRVFTCGINEKGSAPGEGVEPEGSCDEFKEIKFSNLSMHGKIVRLACGASFSAALTDKGSVIAWGNLRDSSGEVNVHPLLLAMKERPTVVIHHKKRVIAKIAAGENHLVMLSESGQILTFGEGSMGQLGRSTRPGNIRGQYMVDDSGNHLIVHVLRKAKKILFKDVFAGGFWTMGVANDGAVYAFGLNNFGQLGIPVDEVKAELQPVKEEDNENGEGEETRRVKKKRENGEEETEEMEADAPPEDDRELRVCLPTESPLFSHTKWTHIAGVQHIVARSEKGEIFAIGKNTDNALGLGTWTGKDDSEHWKYSTLEKVALPCAVAGVSATLGASVAWGVSGEAWSWGYDTSGQLGLGIKEDEDDKVVGKPEKISSAHLEGYQIISVSCADNHSLFLAKKI